MRAPALLTPASLPASPLSPLDSFSDGWNVYDPITDYAKSVRGTPIFEPTLARWEKFAEAVAVAVFGQAYEKWSGKFLLSDHEVRNQSGRVLELLNGWR